MFFFSKMADALFDLTEINSIESTTLTKLDWENCGNASLKVFEYTEGQS